MSGAYLGPAFDDDDCEQRLAAAGARFVRLDDDALIERTADDLADGKAVGWFQGRMEFGPRALGNRSIIARSALAAHAVGAQPQGQIPRSRSVPFAPAVLREDVADWFDLDGDSPYMLLVADVVKRRRRSMTAAEQALFGIDKLNVRAFRHPGRDPRRLFRAHSDRSCRDQPALPCAADRPSRRKTGCPVLVNTSFNVRGEPIVCTPEDAFRCFMGTELEFARGRQLYMAKGDQDPWLKRDYKDAFELD